MKVTLNLPKIELKIMNSKEVEVKIENLERSLCRMKKEMKEIIGQISAEDFDKFSDDYIEENGRDAYIKNVVGI